MQATRPPDAPTLRRRATRRLRWLWGNVLGIGEQRWQKTDDEEVRPARTLWDLLGLLVVPLVLLLLAQHLTQTQDRRVRDIADEQRRQNLELAAESRRQQALEHYLELMNGLLLDHHLARSASTSPARAAARAFTLTVLPQLDGIRKARVIAFLHDDELLDWTRETGGTNALSLNGADLRGADFRDAPLERINLAGADLRYAKFDRVFLHLVNFAGADLLGASFRRSVMFRVAFNKARLTNDRFERAVILSGEGRTTFRGTCVTNVQFNSVAGWDQVDLRNAEGYGPVFQNDNLQGVRVSRPPLLADVRLERTRSAPPELAKRLTRAALRRPSNYICRGPYGR